MPKGVKTRQQLTGKQWDRYIPHKSGATANMIRQDLFFFVDPTTVKWLVLYKIENIVMSAAKEEA